MHGREVVKEVIREEWKKLSGLTWGQRLGYVWEYYKPLMLGILGVIAVISIAVTMYRNAQIETVFQGYLINCSNLSDITEQMGQEFGDYLGGVENNQEILLSPLSYDPEDTTQYGVANQMKLTTLMAAGDVDVFIMDEETYGELQNLGAFKELSGLLTSEQMEKWKRICTMTGILRAVRRGYMPWSWIHPLSWKNISSTAAVLYMAL